MFDFVLDRQEDYQVLRALLRQVGYTEERITERLGCPSIYEFRSMADGRADDAEVSSPLDVMVRLFMDERVLDRETILEHLNSEDLDFLTRIGLLEQVADAGFRASVLLYPTVGLWIASDLQQYLKGQVIHEDSVYPAITTSTQHFLSALPKEPCARFLELCSGTGIAALLAASNGAGHAWAVDVADRSTRSARFNAQLNGLTNFTALTGDLYGPVEGLTFDRIVAHPPYVPAPEVEFIYRDAGPDGEHVTRGVVAGAPAHLAAAGKLHCTCMLSDRKGQPLQQRLRGMLGPEHAKFDILVASMGLQSPDEYFAKKAVKGKTSHDELKRRRKLFRELEIENLVYASFTVQRAEARDTVFTARTRRGPRTTSGELEWLLAWEAAQTHTEVAEFLDVAPRATRGIRLFTVHQLGATGWEPVEHNIGSESPFLFEGPCPPWAGDFLARCDGVRTVRDHFRWLREHDRVPPDSTETDFADLIRTLITAGLIQIDSFPLPRSDGNRWEGAGKMYESGQTRGHA